MGVVDNDGGGRRGRFERGEGGGEVFRGGWTGDELGDGVGEEFSNRLGERRRDVGWGADETDDAAEKEENGRGRSASGDVYREREKALHSRISMMQLGHGIVEVGDHRCSSEDCGHC